VGAEHEDRHRPEGDHLPGDVDAVRARKLQVQDHEIRQDSKQRGQRVLARRAPRDDTQIPIDLQVPREPLSIGG
jgi:hypothetical protein